MLSRVCTVLLARIAVWYATASLHGGMLNLTRVDLQALATERLADANRLRAGGRWTGAYHLAGYAVEVGLKSRVLADAKKSGRLFKDKLYAQSLLDSWTHDLAHLILAGLKNDLALIFELNTPFTGFWGVTKE